MYHVHSVQHLKAAAQKIYKHGALKNSNKNGEYDIYGAMGELYIYELFKPFYNVQGGFPENHVGKYDYDLIINKMKIEVKTAAVPRMPPSDNWYSKIFETSMHQKPDWYFFVHVTKDLLEAAFVGMVSREKWLEQSVIKKKGEEMETNGSKMHYYLNDSRILKNSELSRFKDIRLNTLHNTHKKR